MSIMVEFDNEGTLYPISSNITKHQQARHLAKCLGKASYRFIYLNIEGISAEFLLEENKQD